MSTLQPDPGAKPPRPTFLAVLHKTKDNYAPSKGFGAAISATALAAANSAAERDDVILLWKGNEPQESYLANP